MAYRIAVTAREGGDVHTFDFDRDLVLVGRRAGVDLLLPHPDVGGVHFRLEREGKLVTLVDAGLGTVVGGERLQAGQRLALEPGTLVEIAGIFKLRYVGGSPAPATPTTPDGTRSMARAIVRDLLVTFGRSAAETAAVIEVVAGPATGQRVSLPPPGRDLVIGRGETCDAALVDPDLSREHARIRRGHTATTICDLGSKNGTEVGGTMVAPGDEQPLHHGDRVRLGNTVFVYRDPAEAFIADLARPKPRAPVRPRRGLIFLALTLIALALAALVWLLRA